MEILDTTGLRQWANERDLSDQWWYAIDGVTSKKPVRLISVPHTGDVYVLNAQITKDPDEAWFQFRYPGYRTPGEKAEAERKDREKNALTERQKVDLEFFGRRAESLDRNSATRLLDDLFSKNKDLAGYREHLWRNRHRAYDRRELLLEFALRLQRREFFLRNDIAEEKLSHAVDAAIRGAITEEHLIDFLRENYTHFLLPDSVRKTELAKAGRQSEFFESEPPKKKGCFSLILGGIGLTSFYYFVR